MDRLNRIIGNETYVKHLHNIEELEKERIFCRHTMEHFLNVARIATILAIDEGAEIDRELIYAAGLLHDIGRDEQYENGVPHEIASARLAEAIMKEAGYDENMTQGVIRAILSHRDKDNDESDMLSSVIKRADKLSRQCFWCSAADKCHKKPSGRNETLSC